ncbi:ArsR/SmtB family transcription factor [Actinophytocola oryzae]|uniref:ArsR family transcriptional regulator n=1 Tax=Actinophytocola oryzae TaxID=502181 RepID=A0A4R7W5K7_9PSEU|nr:metalloregulator ArsR/SmtB family transcription factor [Actinophytocola oryzae]TDV57259.1 ArsR family transcriptional regulator [Actinophytocola oryzae]
MYARDAGPDAPHWGELPPAEEIDVAVESFRMLADPTRLRMMWLLSGGEYDVTTLAAAVGIARPAVSQHLAKLRLTGLVTTRRDGRRALYRVRGDHVRRMLAEALGTAQHQVADLPDHD